MTALLSSPSLKQSIELTVSKNIFVPESTFVKELSRLTSIERDLLHLAASIYAADLAVIRDSAMSNCREINLEIALVNWQLFDALRTSIEDILYVLSRDYWVLRFYGGIKSAETTKRALRHGTAGAPSVLLYSGGLDSFAAAASAVKKNEELCLVSHITANSVVKKSQEVTHTSLEAVSGRTLKRYAFHVYPRNTGKYRFPKDNYRENSQRARSFLFLTLAGITAKMVSSNKIIYLAENGQFAIHLPLTSARVGSFSTHTADPRFVTKMQKLLASVLDLPDLRILNPFLYMTKSEVTNLIGNEFRGTISETVSCWKASRLPSDRKHCGECVPCLARRIALESIGIKLDEYARDLFAEDIGSLDEFDDGKRNLVDLLQLVNDFSDKPELRVDEISYNNVDLISPDISLIDAVKMYGRFAKEARKVCSAYPGVRQLLT